MFYTTLDFVLTLACVLIHVFMTFFSVGGVNKCWIVINTFLKSGPISKIYDFVKLCNSCKNILVELTNKDPFILH